jgi:hypothetical protein
VYSWITYAVCALAQRTTTEPLGFRTGKITHDTDGRRKFEHEVLKEEMGCRFILFRVPDYFESLDHDRFEDYCEKVETTYAFALKGGMHLFGTEQNPIVVQSLHFDGYEHYQRHINIEKVRLVMNQLRSYCSLSQNLQIDDRGSDHRIPDKSQSFDDCQLLQLTDVLVGAFRTILGESKNQVQLRASQPVAQLVHRWNQGPARMRNSRWYRSFSISECLRQNGNWHFQNIQKAVGPSGQLTIDVQE